MHSSIWKGLTNLVDFGSGLGFYFTDFGSGFHMSGFGQQNANKRSSTKFLGESS